jgi:hypothetical protein
MSVVPGSLAYAGPLHRPEALVQYSEWALVQAQDDVYVFTVTAIRYEPDPDQVAVALEAATAMLDAMAATPAGLATPAASPGEAPVSGAWAKFPAEDDEVPQRYGITYTEDRVNYAPEPLPGVVLATYGDAEGLVTMVSRDYGMPEPDNGEAPEWPIAFVELAVFDEAANAQPALATAATTQLSLLDLDSAGLEDVEANVQADEAVAYAGEVEFEGERFGVAVILSQTGPYVLTVVVVTTDDDNAQAFAEEISQAAIEADASEGEGTFSDDGTSRGGVWDKLPDAGDEVLRGLEPVGDSQHYP